MRGNPGGRAVRARGPSRRGRRAAVRRRREHADASTPQGKPRSAVADRGAGAAVGSRAPPDRAADRGRSSRTAAPRPPPRRRRARWRARRATPRPSSGTPRLLEGRRRRRTSRSRARSRWTPTAARATRPARSSSTRAALWLLTGDAAHAARVESGGSQALGRPDRARPAAPAGSRARAARAPCSAPTRRRRPRTVTFVGDPKQAELRQGRPHRARRRDARRDALGLGLALAGRLVALRRRHHALRRREDGQRRPERPRRARARRATAGRRAGARRPRPSTARTACSTATRSAAGGSRAACRDARRRLARDGRRVDGVARQGPRASTAWRSPATSTWRTAPSGRTAKAEKAVDYPKQGKTVLWGAPARVTDAGGNQVAGAILTIFDRGRSVEITAPEGGKTETIHRTRKELSQNVPRSGDRPVLVGRRPRQGLRRAHRRARASRSRSPRARSSACSGPTARARRRSSPWSSGSSGPTSGVVRLGAQRRHRAARCTAARAPGSPTCRRSRRSSGR